MVSFEKEGSLKCSVYGGAVIKRAMISNKKNHPRVMPDKIRHYRRLITHGAKC